MNLLYTQYTIFIIILVGQTNKQKNKSYYVKYCTNEYLLSLEFLIIFLIAFPIVCGSLECVVLCKGFAFVTAESKIKSIFIYTPPHKSQIDSWVFTIKNINVYNKVQKITIMSTVDSLSILCHSTGMVVAVKYKNSVSGGE